MPYGFTKAMQSMPQNKAIGGAICVWIGIGTGLTVITRSLGEDLGGSSSGQPKTTHANWAKATEGYSDFQRCNPIRNDKTFGPLKYSDD